MQSKQNTKQNTQKTHQTKVQDPGGEGNRLKAALALTPLQKFKSSKNKDIELQERGILNHVLFLFLNKVINSGSERPYDFDMLYKPHEQFTHKYNFKNFTNRLEKAHSGNKSKRFYDILLDHVMYPDYWISDLLLGLCYIIQTPVPWLAKKLIEWIEDPDADARNGWIYAAWICGLVSARLLIFHQGLYMKCRIESQMAVSIRVSLITRIKCPFDKPDPFWLSPAK